MQLRQSFPHLYDTDLNNRSQVMMQSIKNVKNGLIIASVLSHVKLSSNSKLNDIIICNANDKSKSKCHDSIEVPIKVINVTDLPIRLGNGYVVGHLSLLDNDDDRVIEIDTDNVWVIM